MSARVLFLDHAGVVGGAELFLLELGKRWTCERKVLLFAEGPFCECLKRARVPVEVIQATESLTAVARDGSGLAQFFAIPDIWRLARQVATQAADFDVLFANSQKALVIGALAAWMAGKKLVWYLHDILTAEHFSKLNRWVAVTFGNRFADRIVANSQASLNAFVASGGRRERTAVVYNGIDASPIDAAETCNAGKKIRDELGWSESKIVGLFSRIAPWKGQHVLLDALAQVPRLKALLVGAPLFGNDKCYQRELEAKVQALGLSDRVRFLGFREDIPSLLQAVNFVAHTSVSPEPFGRVIVEGMLAGKPVVATAAGGACEIIEDGVTGRLIPPGDSAALAAVLHDFADRPEATLQMGEAGRSSARSRFSPKAMLDGIDREVMAAIERPNREF